MSLRCSYCLLSPCSCGKELYAEIPTMGEQIYELKQQLAAAQAKVKELEFQVYGWESSTTAAQARIAELREALEYGPKRLEALKARDLNCGCDHNEYCEKCFPPEFQSGGRFFSMPEQVMREALAKPDDLSALESIKRQARREALMEAAEHVELGHDWLTKVAVSAMLRRMAEEVKP